MTDRSADLVLLRHGESTANAAGMFTGMLDVPLTERGVEEAVTAAHLLAAARIRTVTVLSSTMLRARQTAEIVLAELGMPASSLVTDWRLNERNYGALTGRSKREVLREYGEERFRRWRRSLDESPPPMTEQQRLAIAVAATPEGRPPAGLGLTEDLADVIIRVQGCLDDRIRPALRDDATVLVVAHGNSLRALVAILEDLSPPAVEALNLPTGQPLVYGFSAGGDRPDGPGRYLDPTTALVAAAAIARQGGT